MKQHVLYTAEDFKNKQPEDVTLNPIYDAVVNGGLNVCKLCGEYEAGLDKRCKGA